MRAIEEVLDYCRQGGIQLGVFIHAYHVDVLEIIFETGHWSAFELWKHELVKLCHEYDNPIWDFAQVNAWTTKEPPKHNDRKTIMADPGKCRAAP